MAAHATVHPGFATLIDSYRRALPSDWDVVCLGSYYRTPPVHVGGQVFRPTDFSLVHGYAVRDGAAGQLLERSQPHESVEQALGALQTDGSLNVYALWPNLVCPRGSPGSP